MVNFIESRAATGRLPTEHEEQRLLVQWFRRKWPDLRIFAIANGGARSLATAGRLKAEGVSPGVPDLFVPAMSLWIEMKRRKGGSISAEQRDWHKYLRSLGHEVIVGRGFDDAMQKILLLLNQQNGLP